MIRRVSGSGFRTSCSYSTVRIGITFSDFQWSMSSW